MNLHWHGIVTQSLVHFGVHLWCAFYGFALWIFHHYESAWHLGSLAGTYKGEGGVRLYHLHRRKWLSTCYAECGWVWTHLGAMQKLSGPSPGPALPNSAHILTRSPISRVSSPFLSPCCPRENLACLCELESLKIDLQGLKLESWKLFLLGETHLGFLTSSWINYRSDSHGISAAVSLELISFSWDLAKRRG